MTSPITEIPLDTLSLERFEPVINASRRDQLSVRAERTRTLLAGRTFWNLNSTAKGGVAEMLASLLPYARGAGIETPWLVIDGNEDFFTVSKRIHNQLHGNDGDGQDLGKDARRIYEHALAQSESDPRGLIHPGDVVLFHDPQTAGLVSSSGGGGPALV